MGGSAASNLLDRLEDQATRTPNQTVYEFLEQPGEARGLTYTDLCCRARAIAAQLGDAARPGDRVLLALGPGLDYAAHLWGCLYAGLVAVPVLPPTSRASRERLPGIVQDSAARLMVTDASRVEAAREWLRSRAEELQQPLDLEVTACPAGVSADFERVPRDPDQPVVLQYTSGSTSRPKGVPLTGGNISANLVQIQEAMGIRPGWIGVSWLPPYHDMGLIGNLLGSPYFGSILVFMAPATFVQRPWLWLEQVSERGAAITGGPTFAYELCAATTPDAIVEGLDLSSLEVAYCGAEPVSADVLTRFATRFAPAGFDPGAFLPCYGLAEATLFVSGKRGRRTPSQRAFSVAELERGRVVEVGAELPERRTLVGHGWAAGPTELRIVDPETLTPAAPGRIGEIWVRGPSVASGYWNPGAGGDDAFDGRMAGGRERHLRTGDLGFVHDGELFITGRIKEVIIVRGRNLHPTDLERVARAAHPSLSYGITAAFAVDDGDREGVAVAHEWWRRSEPPAGIALDELAEEIRRKVAEEFQLQPAAILLLPSGAIPRTSSGKIRRGRCAELHREGTLGRLAFHSLVPGHERSPATPPEREGRGGTIQILARLEQLVRELPALAHVDVDPERPVVDLGIDSLDAAQLVGRIRDRLGVEIELEEIYEGATLLDLARRCARSGGLTEARSKAVAAGVREGPLSSSQARLWFWHRLDPKSSAYNMPTAVEIFGKLSPERLHASLALLVARQPALRTRFVLGPDGPCQQLCPEPGFDLALEDLGAKSEGDQLEIVRRESARAPAIDIESPPLFRARLFRLAEERHLLLFEVHHIVFDGWSLGVLMRELSECYEALEEGRPPRLPELPIGLVDHALWEQGADARRLYARQLDFWREYLRDAPALLALPAPGPRPALQTFEGTLARHVFDRTATAAIEAVCRERTVSPFMFLLASYFAALWAYTRESDLCVGIALSNRPHAELEHLMGFFVNTAVVRERVAARLRFGDLLSAVRASCLRVYRNQDVPFEDVVRALKPTRSPSYTPLFQAAFSLSNVGLGEIGTRGGRRWRPFELDGEQAKFDLDLTVTPFGGELHARLEGSRAVLGPAFSERFLAAYASLAERAVHEPDATLAELARPLGDAGTSASSATAPLDEIARALAEVCRLGPESKVLCVLPRDSEAAEVWRRAASRVGGSCDVLGELAEGRAGQATHLVGPLEWVAGLLRAGRIPGGVHPVGLGAPTGRLWSDSGETPLTTILTDCGLPVAALRLPATGARVAVEPLHPGLACLVDEEGLPVPAGVPGRLDRRGELLLRSSEGSLEYEGRVERLRRVNGVPVSLDAAERAIVGTAGLRAARALVTSPRGHRGYLVAHVVQHAGDSRSAADLERALKLELPDFLCPDLIVQVPEIPFDPAIADSALSADAHELEQRESFVAPRSAMEREICALWSSELAVEAVGLHDNFFDLGGDSLRATALVAQINERLGATLCVPLFLQNPTVAELARTLASSRGAPRPAVATKG